ncbi:hypothetical protein SAMN04488074_122118 [Lentzea albidocapillata subsp. violacea]|uniref:Uncharacterized protein n=2 Tax=Lentzea albidocapillata TaxID=40571 RepID=A0A1G9TTG1_9PSEU|nr:hypothetical protein SAMN04488074_122118 [Lentzea albidocapillata subsp. violacea]
MKLDRTIDRVDVYAVALATLRSFGVSGGSVAVAGHPSIRVLTKLSTDGVCGWREARRSSLGLMRRLNRFSRLLVIISRVAAQESPVAL